MRKLEKVLGRLLGELGVEPATFYYVFTKIHKTITSTYRFVLFPGVPGGPGVPGPSRVRSQKVLRVVPEGSRRFEKVREG